MIQKRFLLLFLGLGLFANAQPDWQFAKEEKGIKVYIRDHTGREIKEFRAITTFKNGSIKDFYRLFIDGDNASKWSYSVMNSKTIASPSANENIVYYQLEMPWPMHPRDVVQRQTITLKEDTKEVTCVSYSIPDYIPRKKGFVRVEESDVKWTVKQINSTDVLVTYEFFTDPKVAASDHMIDYFIQHSPILVLVNLRNYFEKNLQTLVKYNTN